MRPLLVIVALVAVQIVLTLLPLIPDLTVIRQAVLLCLGVSGLALVVVNASKRWSALPDLRRRIVASSALAALVVTVGTLGCLVPSPVGGPDAICTVRAVQLAQAPIGYDGLVPERTTYRFSRSCMGDDFPESWYQQSRLIFLVGSRVREQA
jgi:hypothetical protein